MSLMEPSQTTDFSYLIASSRTNYFSLLLAEDLLLLQAYQKTAYSIEMASSDSATAASACSITIKATYHHARAIMTEVLCS